MIKVWIVIILKMSLAQKIAASKKIARE